MDYETRLSLLARTRRLLCTGQAELGWSDLALFVIFENGKIAADQVYFLYKIPKNMRIFLFLFTFSSLKIKEDIPLGAAS